MQKRRLRDLEVSAIGLGCMGMTPIYGDPDEDEAIATIHRAIDLGVDLIDTSDMYGNGKNEELVGRGLRGRRDRVILATKFGNIRLPDGTSGVNGRPEYVRQACDASLKRLGTEMIDLYFVHRIDPDVPIEDTVGEMSRLKEAGKIRYLGLSEAGPSTLRRADAVHPITALQTEYSLWSREPEQELIPTCRELGVGYIAYSPLGRGFLTATIDGPGSLSESDRRRDMPRFQGENLERNRKLIPVLEHAAKAENCTPAQMALAWVLAQGEDIVPIPGTKRRKWLEQNVDALSIVPSRSSIEMLSEAFAPEAIAGTRYPVGQMSRLGI